MPFALAGRVYAEPEAEVIDEAPDGAVEEEEEDEEEEEVLVEEPQIGDGVRTFLMLIYRCVDDVDHMRLEAID